MRTPTFSVEVITLPVSDVERALRFYVDQVGFTLDVDCSSLGSSRNPCSNNYWPGRTPKLERGSLAAPQAITRGRYLITEDGVRDRNPSESVARR